MPKAAVGPAEALAINGVLVSARQAIDIVCDRWSLALIVALLLGTRRFNDLLQSTGMASRLLASRLQALEADGLIVRMPYSMRPLRHEYRLTNMGGELFDVVLQLARWERHWSGESTRAARLIHVLCGSELSLDVQCRNCGRTTTARDVDVQISRAQLHKVPNKAERHRRSTISSEQPRGEGQLLGESLDIFGDKWGIEVLLCAFFRIHRFSDFRAAIGISANILSDRLARLVAAGLLTQGRDAADRTGYWLTPKGIDIYGIMETIHEWADKWVRGRYRSPVLLVHRACGETFRPAMGCAHCKRPVAREEVELRLAGKAAVMT